MRSFAKVAAALAVALPLMGIAGAGTAKAADVQFSVSVGNYDQARYGYGEYRRHDRVISPRRMMRYLRANYREVRDLDRRGDVYIARAEDHRGRDIRITASAYTGQVIDVDYTRRDRDRRDDRNDRRRDRWDDNDGRDRDGDGRDRDRTYYR